MEPDSALEALGNEYSAEILSAAAEPRSAQEFSELLDVPIATCYRRIEQLTDAGLLTLHDRVLSDGRRRTNVYRREVDEVRVEFDGDGCTLSASERPEVRYELDAFRRDVSGD